jgi:hypothetical protein
MAPRRIPGGYRVTDAHGGPRRRAKKPHQCRGHGRGREPTIWKWRSRSMAPVHCDNRGMLPGALLNEVPNTPCPGGGPGNAPHRYPLSHSLWPAGIRSQPLPWMGAWFSCLGGMRGRFIRGLPGVAPATLGGISACIRRKGTGGPSTAIRPIRHRPIGCPCRSHRGSRRDRLALLPSLRRETFPDNHAATRRPSARMIAGSSGRAGSARTPL